MKTTLTLIIMLTSISFCKAQYAKELDDKNGFNIFVLGEDISEVKKLAKLKSHGSDPENKSIAYYEVKNIKDFKIFEYPLKSIELYFYDAKLYCISISPSFVYNSEQNELIHQDILSRVQKQYGGFQEKELTSQDKLYGRTAKYELYGKKVLLRFLGGVTNYAFYDIQIRNKIMSEEKSGL